MHVPEVGRTRIGVSLTGNILVPICCVRARLYCLHAELCSLCRYDFSPGESIKYSPLSDIKTILYRDKQIYI